MLAKDIMTKEVITVTKEDNVETVIKLILEHNISGLPVINEESHVIGIITEGDLIYRSKKLHVPSFFTLLDSYIFLENPKNLEGELKKITGYKVKDVMTEDVVTVSADDEIEKIATFMAKDNINRIPVVKDKKLVGIVSRRDIIKGYANQK